MQVVVHAYNNSLTTQVNLYKLYVLGVCSQGFPCSAIGQGHMAHGFVRHVSFSLHCPPLMLLCKYVWNHDFAKPRSWNYLIGLFHQTA
jgi:hypothetical protein